MKQAIIIILTTLSFQGSAQKLRPEIKDLAQRIQDRQLLDSEYTGKGGDTSDRYYNYLQLSSKANTDELVQLLQHRAAVVKGYASWALLDKKYPKLGDIFTKFLENGETVLTQSGCTLSQDELASVLYYRVFYRYSPEEVPKNDSLFFQTQIIQFDSILINHKKENSLLSTALQHNNGNPKHYNRIRQLAFNNKNSDALQALAIYQRKEDIEAFKKFGEDAFASIALFPDDEFWDFLLSFKEHRQSDHYLMALAAFRSKKSAEVLSETLPEMKDSNADYVISGINDSSIENFSKAISKNYCIHYQDLILKVWEQYKVIDHNATTKLIQDIPEKAATSFSAVLLSDKALNFVEYDPDIGTIHKILPKMLECIKTCQKSELLMICEQNIRIRRNIILEQFLEFVKDNHLTETSDEILNKLQQENLPHDIFYLTETILSFNIPENNEKVIALLKTKRKDWDIDHLSERFSKLFQTYGLKID